METKAMAYWLQVWVTPQIQLTTMDKVTIFVEKCVLVVVVLCLLYLGLVIYEKFKKPKE